MRIPADATYAVNTWKTFTLPDGDVPYMATKAQRHFAMRDDVACTIHWPILICYKHLPEDVNDLCDWITRRAEWVRAAARKAQGLPLELDLSDDISTPNDPTPAPAVCLALEQYAQEAHEAYLFSTVTYHDDKHSKKAATDSPYPLPKGCQTDAGH